MASAEKELEQQLREAGEKLSNFPTEVNQLLSLLDNVENLLSKVEQSPSETIQNAYSQSMKALLAEPLLRHEDADVKVAVASCISEITRITAPEAPYNDDQMKEIFQLIVSSFADLSNRSSRSYDKRASILETVAKVRSCVVMLDLECDGMISEMFQHFLSSIRDYHEEHIFTSMETIMTLVLDESEDVSVELLGPILASLKRDNEEILPIARKLGESVFEKCAVKLKPYLEQAVQTLGLPLDGYSKIVATICNGTNSKVDHKEENVSGEQLADEIKLAKTSSDEIAQDAKDHVSKEGRLEEGPPEVEKSVKSVLSNGMSEASDKDKSNVPDSSKKPDEGNLSSLNMDVNLNKMDTDYLDTEKSAKVDSKQEKTPKKRGRKPSSKPNVTKLSDSSLVDSDKETEITPQKISDKEADKSPDIEKDDSKDAHVSLGDDSHADTLASPEKEKELRQPISSVKQLENAVNASSMSPGKSLPDESLPKKVSLSKKKENLAEEDASSVNPSPGKVDAETSGIVMKPEGHSEKKQNFAQEDALPMDIVSSKADDADSDSEVEPQIPSGKKKGNVVQDHEPSVDPHPVAVAAADGSSDSEIKPQKVSRKRKGNLGQEDEPPVVPVSTKVAGGDGSRDSEVEAHRQSGKKKENLTKEVSADLLLSKVDDEISDSDDKPLRLPGKKAAALVATGGRSCTKKGRKSTGGRGKSKTKIEDNVDAEKNQPKLAKNGEGSDSETKPLIQSGNKEITSRPRGQPRKKSGKKGIAPGTKLSKEDACEDDKDSSQEDDGKRRAHGKNSKVKNEDKDSSQDDDGKRRARGKNTKEKMEDKDSSQEDNGKRRARGKNTKEKLLSKSHTKDDDQDMIISPKSSSKSVKDDQFVSPKVNSKRKRTPGKDKVSEDLEYGDNLVGSKVKVWWPEDEEYYEGFIESYSHGTKKHKVLYTDGEKEILVLRKEKWEFVNDETTREEANEDPNLDSSAKSRSRKKAKTISESTPKQKQMDVSPPRRSGAVASSKSKGTSNKSGGKVDISKDKTSKTNGKSEDDLGSDADVLKTSSKPDEEAKSKHENPKTVTKSKGKVPPIGSTSNGSGTVKSTLSKGKDSGNATEKPSDSGKTPETAGEAKSQDTSKAGKSGGKSGKKRRRSRA